ncbi:MAG: hypothetical protein ACREQV_26395, partial [Candidatus Binatia bacterium]
MMRTWEPDPNLALAFPSNFKCAGFPHLMGGKPTIVSREGIVLLEEYGDSQAYLHMMEGSDALIEWLKQKEVAAAPSSAGRTAKQVIRSIEGCRNAWLLEDAETLKLLNKMANRVDRTAKVQEWKRILQSRTDRKRVSDIDVKLDSFVRSGMLRLGLVARCPHCGKENWYGLREVDYSISCDRCLREFEFPQGGPIFKEAAWRYRVVGPFSARDYADGAYASVLTLRTFAHKLGSGQPTLTYTTGLDLFDNLNQLE